MAVTFNTEAIVLRREDWNGNDSRVTFFTKTHGKIEAVARGLRKAKSKLAAHLEPLTETEVFLVEGRRFPIVAGSVPHERNELLRHSLSALSGAGLIVRLTDLMTPFESRDDHIFSLLTEALDILAADETIDENQILRFVHAFAWKLLVAAGYHAELRTCLECGKPISGEAVIFDVRRGGVLHEACKANGGLRVSFAAIKGLAYMVEAPLADALRLRSLNGGISEMNTLVEAMVEERFEVGAESRFWAIL